MQLTTQAKTTTYEIYWTGNRTWITVIPSCVLSCDQLQSTEVAAGVIHGVDCSVQAWTQYYQTSDIQTSENSKSIDSLWSCWKCLHWHWLCLHFNGHFPGRPGLAGTRMSPFWILLELRLMEVMMTTGVIRRAKLQSTCHPNKPTPSF